MAKVLRLLGRQLAKGRQRGRRHCEGGRCKSPLVVVDRVVLLRLRRRMQVVVLLLVVRLERLRNIVIVPSDSTSCCARIIRPLLPGVDILT